MSERSNAVLLECQYDMSVKYGAERDGVGRSGVEILWNERFDNKIGTTLASARVLCLDLLSCVWLHISGGLNCCQELWRGVV